MQNLSENNEKEREKTTTTTTSPSYTLPHTSPSPYLFLLAEAPAMCARSTCGIPPPSPSFASPTFLVPSSPQPSSPLHPVHGLRVSLQLILSFPPPPPPPPFTLHPVLFNDTNELKRIHSPPPQLPESLSSHQPCNPHLSSSGHIPPPLPPFNAPPNPRPYPPHLEGGCSMRSDRVWATFSLSLSPPPPPHPTPSLFIKKAYIARPGRNQQGGGGGECLLRLPTRRGRVASTASTMLPPPRRPQRCTPDSLS